MSDSPTLFEQWRDAKPAAWRWHPDVDAEVDAFLVFLGSVLRQERERRGWTIAELASLVGISPALLSRYEAATRVINLARLFQLCRALERQPESIVAKARRRAKRVAVDRRASARPESS